MALPVPNLDDRRFQDLVDDAKRLVQQRCPEWTDHNVSDPGVTLIEAFAWMTDQLLYRLNRVPDRHYVKFLELIGVRLFPPAAARGDVTFWLSAPQPDAVRIAGGTQVATIRTETDDAVVFTTLDDLPIVPVTLAHVLDLRRRQEARATARPRPRNGRDFPPSRRRRWPATLLLVGISEAAPANAVRLDFRLHDRGRRASIPTWPPLAWEAWTGDGWAACELERDTTGGLNRDGEVILHVPRGPRRLGGREAAGGVAPRPRHGARGGPAVLLRLARACVAWRPPRRRHGRRGPRRRGRRRDRRHLRGRGRPALPAASGGPVVPGDRPTAVRVSDDEDGWQEWTQVPDFSGSGPEDRHFVLDAVAGEISFGPAVREPDGSVRALRGRAGEGTPHPGRRLPHRRRPARQPRAAVDQRPQVVDPVREPRGEPAADGRRRGRRGDREREGPRPDHAPLPRPRRDHGGLRAPRARGGARAGAGPRGGRRRRRRRGIRAGPRRAGGAGRRRAPSLRAARPVGRDPRPRRRPPRRGARRRDARDRGAAGLPRDHDRRPPAARGRG